MKRMILLALVIMAGASFNLVNAQDKKQKKKKKDKVTIVTAEPVQFVNEVDSFCYAVGLINGEGMLEFISSLVDTAYVNDFKRGFVDAANISANSAEAAYFYGAHLFLDFSKNIGQNLSSGDSTYTLSKQHLLAGMLNGVDHNYQQMSLDGATSIVRSMASLIQKKAEQRKQEKNAKTKQEGKDFLELNAKAPGVITLPSGLQYKVLREGSGPVATTSDKVTVHYEGRLLDGTVFDSSYNRGQPSTFTPAGVIKGWTEALTMMPEGSIWELYIPENLAYGDRDSGPIPPYSTLIFKVEVIKVGDK